MRPMLKHLMCAAVATALFVVWGVRSDHDVVVAQQRQPVTFTHVFTGPDGLSKVETLNVKLTGAADSEMSEMYKVSGLQFRRQPPKYFSDFHPAPRKQFVITLRGEGEIELTGGKVISAKAGDVLLMEDVTGKGHISRGRGTEDRITLFIPIAED